MDATTFLLFSLLLLLYCMLTVGRPVTVNLSSRGVTRLGDPLKYIAVCLDCPNPELEGSMMKGLVAKHGIQDFDFTGELIYCFPNHGDGDKILNRREFTNKIVMVDRGKVPFLKKIENILGITTRNNGETVVHVNDINDRTIDYIPGTSPFVLNSLGVGGIIIVDDGVDGTSSGSGSGGGGGSSGSPSPVAIRGRGYGPAAVVESVSSLAFTNSGNNRGGCDEEFLFCHPLLGSPAAGGFAPHDNIKAWGNVLVPVVFITKKSGDKLKALMGTKQEFIPGFGLQYLVNNNEGSGNEGEGEYLGAMGREERQESDTNVNPDLMREELELHRTTITSPSLPVHVDHDRRIKGRMDRLIGRDGRSGHGGGSYGGGTGASEDWSRNPLAGRQWQHTFAD